MRRILQRSALGVAVASLLMLGWSALHPAVEAGSAVTDVTLLTDGAEIPPSHSGAWCALPGATRVPEGAQRMPDTAFLRRNFPQLQRIEIVGDGVEPSDAAALQGLTITWHRPAAPRQGPSIVAVIAPREVRVGQSLTVQGRVRVFAAGEAVTLNLTGPEGVSRAVEVRASADGQAIFSVTSGPTMAPGTFEWTLTLGAGGEGVILGATVTKPDLPRVLILQAAPNFETGRLQRWLAESGSRVLARTKVSAEHFRFAAANGAPAEFANVDADLLAGFDVIVASEAALLELSATERLALEDAVRLRGLGVCVIGEPSAVALGEFFSPWQLTAVGQVDEGGEWRTTRLRLADGTEMGEPVAVLDAEIAPAPLQRWLVRDSSGRVLGAALPRDRGSVARTLVTDTWRWAQGGHGELFAAYWSHLLSAVAGLGANEGGHWTMENPSAPIFAGEPVQLSRIGSPTEAPPHAEVRGPDAKSAVPLNLVRDPAEPARAATSYWPDRAGWHVVRAPVGGASLAFYVQPAAALPALRAERRHLATARLVEGSSGPKSPRSDVASPATSRRWIDGAAFAIFVLSVSVLWLEPRRRVGA